ncbi:MAG TPA: hypothetical protein DGV70_03225 [Faecalibacterium sp.]|nr:hypothetical protein [Faecalibacterium sp.]
MKIVIETKGKCIAVNVDAPKGVCRSDIAETLSLALASTVASVIPADAPYSVRLMAGTALADEIAKAVKENFLEVVTGKAGKTAVFTDKEAEFMREVLGL